MKKIVIIGFFARNTRHNGGQEHKTRALSQALQNARGREAVTEVDTLGWPQHPLGLLVRLLRSSWKSDALIMLPAKKGLLVFAPLLQSLKKLGGKKIYYDVIGGWLPEYLENKKLLTHILRCFDGIWVETSVMARQLEKQGFTNVSIVPNFKQIVPLRKEQLDTSVTFPLKLCTFSRVVPEKGIEDAAAAVTAVNEALGYCAYTLDIYGRIEDHYQNTFTEMQAAFPEYIRYRGCAAPEESVTVLKDYFALLFPTRCFTEGVPGTVVDAYAAGVPVIASRWSGFADVIEEGETGLGFPFGCQPEFRQLLLELGTDPSRLIRMKENCLKKASQYSAQQITERLLQEMED